MTTIVQLFRDMFDSLIVNHYEMSGGMGLTVWGVSELEAEGLIDMQLNN